MLWHAGKAMAILTTTIIASQTAITTAIATCVVIVIAVTVISKIVIAITLGVNTARRNNGVA